MMWRQRAAIAQPDSLYLRILRKRPQRQPLSQPDSAAKKSASVRWKQIPKNDLKKIRKVEIQISTDKNFASGVKKKFVKANKTSLKFGGLNAKKKYYVRIRAYTGKHASAWSTVQSVKTR